ncbi:uncharacterized protein RSE6_07624 [Rhynchosporium secalis]|uniref:Uncharacterized protein n=1 Tax=Rhynchosporium secalis TaxID=38038 RepID=A0A1E1MEE9_RHYSE|nr:uncharacterized protein RSE6_07624 [Rhynchosporium secalis]
MADIDIDQLLNSINSLLMKTHDTQVRIRCNYTKMPGDSKTVDGRSFVMDTLSVDPDLEYVYGRLSDNSRDLAILQYLVSIPRPPRKHVNLSSYGIIYTKHKAIEDRIEGLEGKELLRLSPLVEIVVPGTSVRGPASFRVRALYCDPEEP